MRVDFYQLARDPAEAVLPLIARNTLAAGERLVVVSQDPEQLDRIDRELWVRLPESFLAHGRAGAAHEARQPILLSGEMTDRNGARFCALADGVWRDAEPAFARAFYLFGDAALLDARACWRLLGERDDIERRFWKQDERGKWVEGP